jgi:hypothetical protein
LHAKEVKEKCEEWEEKLSKKYITNGHSPSQYGPAINDTVYYAYITSAPIHYTFMSSIYLENITLHTQYYTFTPLFIVN